MSTLHVTRRRFLQTVGAAAAVGPWSRPVHASQNAFRLASIDAAGQALSDINAFARVSGSRPLRVRDPPVRTGP